MKILHLPLKKEWYEMIESGEKKEEYRALSSYWVSRLIRNSNGEKINSRLYLDFVVAYSTSFNLLKLDIKRDILNFVKFDNVQFSYGYTKRTMTFECKGIAIGKGHKEWGAPDNDVFIIKLGKRIE